MMKIRHVLADGREVESVDGIIVPTTGATAAVYKIVAEFANKHSETVLKDKEEVKTATA